MGPGRTLRNFSVANFRFPVRVPISRMTTTGEVEAVSKNASSDEPSSSHGAQPILEPLTRLGRKRLPRVNAEIISAASLPTAELIAAGRNRNEASPGFLSAEAIVYFIRRASRAEDLPTLNALFGELYGRCQPFFRGKVRGFAKDWQDDIKQAVLKKVAEDLLAEDDRGDFAQERFWTYLEKKTLTACGDAQKKRDRSVSLDDELQSADDEEDPTKPPAPTPEELAFRNEARRLLHKLPPDLRRLFIMRHELGMKIGSDDWTADDPKELTLARYFQVPGRTIRNRLNKVAKLLKELLEK